MTNSVRGYSFAFNKDAYKETQRLTEEIDKENSSDVVDKERLIRLQEQRLMKSMEAAAGLTTRFWFKPY